MEQDTLTVCEGVCHSFDWLIDWGPAIIASSTALLIAFVAYPWQKKKDRELKEHSEKLEAYQRFVRVVTHHHSLIANSLFEKKDGGISAAYPAVVASSYEMIFYAPPSVVAACQHYLESVLTYQNYALGRLGSETHKKVAKEYSSPRAAFVPAQRARRAAILAIRKDIASETDTVSEEVVNAFFTMTPDEEKSA